MKVGYPCIAVSLPCRSSKTFRLASYSEKRMRETVGDNLACLRKIILFNIRHDLLFFRISSDLVPFASHPVCAFPWQKVFREQFSEIGKLIKTHGMRISMHPDQFVLINAQDKEIVRRSVRELEYHAEVLDLLDTGTTAKIQIHVGGVYGDREESILRFIGRYRSLPEKIRRRLVIENDERLYSVGDCLTIYEEAGTPIVFDTLHFRCNNKGENLREAFSKTHATWTDNDGLPLVDYSSQAQGKRPGAHAHSIDPDDFAEFLSETRGFDFDVMCEIKDKEKSALKALQVIRGRR
jgi:UV DNA damage endonuclease